MLTRRRLLGGIAGIVAAGVAATVGIVGLDDRYGFVAAILRRNLPGVPLADAEIRKFVDAYWPGFLTSQGRKGAALLRLAAPVHALLPAGTLISEATERDILTEFLIGSSFFRVANSESAAVEFFDLAEACPNPFYRT
jgi:hypothetical protein